MNRDPLRCWLRSFEEAKQLQCISQDWARCSAEKYFTPKHTNFTLDPALTLYSVSHDTSDWETLWEPD
jgi:hypothetical protein